MDSKNIKTNVSFINYKLCIDSAPIGKKWMDVNE